MLKSYLHIVVWIYGTFDYKYQVKNDITTYFNESCWWWSDEHFAFKYFPNMLLPQRFDEICQAVLAAASTNGLK